MIILHLITGDEIVRVFLDHGLIPIIILIIVSVAFVVLIVVVLIIYIRYNTIIVLLSTIFCHGRPAAVF